MDCFCVRFTIDLVQCPAEIAQLVHGWNNMFSLAKIKRKILNEKTEGEEETENESKSEKV